MFSAYLRLSPAHLAVLIAATMSMGFGSCGKSFNPVDVCVEKANGDRIVVTARSRLQLAHLQYKGATVFGRGLDADCEGGLQVRFESDLLVGEPTLSGFDGGEPRVVGAAVYSDGTQDEFVEDEIQIRAGSDEELAGFIETYDGLVLRDDTVIGMADDGSKIELPGGGEGWHLVRVNPNTVPLDQAIAAFWEHGIRGQLQFSSEAMAATLAIVTLVEGTELGPNQVLEKQDLLEHPFVANPTSDSDFANFANNGTMTEDNDPGEPGDQGLSIGVARAFDYLRHTGLPPIRFGGAWTPTRVAVLDEGFALDPETGVGNPDYVNALGVSGLAPLQVDITNGDVRAGQNFDSSDKPWHGQGAFGICCAKPNNLFGGAGTGGEYIRPVLIRMGGSVWEMASAMRSAAFMQATVVTISWSNTCGGWCEALNDSDLQSAVFNVVAFGGSVFASAGNDGDDISGKTRKPCTLQEVICVGGLNMDGTNRFNFGDPVDIWAPTQRRSTVSPDSADDDPDDFDIDEVKLFDGTSSATPFVAGIAALAKAADTSLQASEIRDLLRDLTGTGNVSPDPLVTRGYPDALRLVQAVRPNPPPEVRFIFPEDGGQDSWFRFDSVVLGLDDPPAPEGFRGTVRIESDRAGVFCEVSTEGATQACSFPSIPVLGTNVITALVEDEFGGQTERSISFTLVNSPPTVTIASPSDGDRFLVGQSVSLSAVVADPDGESPTVRWTSSLDGSIGSGRSLLRQLSAGTHVIEAEATDRYSETAIDTVQIEVFGGAGVPVAQIEFPPDSFSYGPNPLEFRGSAFDPEDGNLSGTSLSWFSDQMGFIGSGSTIEVLLNPNGCGSGHTITLEAVDSDGNVSVDTISIVRAVC